MAIIGVQHIGVAVRDYHRAVEQFRTLFGLQTQDFRDNQGPTQHDGRILLGNGCWLHVVHNWNPQSRVAQFVERHGEGLEHIALLSDDIFADVRRVSDAGVPFFGGRVFRAPDGWEAFVYPEYNNGVTVELIQPHRTSWQYPAASGPLSPTTGIVQLQHIGLAVNDCRAACQRFEELFGLRAQDFRTDQNGTDQVDARILLGNRCWLHVVENKNPQRRVNQFIQKHGEGIEHIALQTTSIEADVAHLKSVGVSVFQDRIFNAPDGFETFIYPDSTPGVTVELIQPHATSWAWKPA
ncbi:MAG: hypothetical protein GX605_06050 [Chloroflexi bacterium]|nr:hypothetical protein [Chloroflexota bacterium]